MPSTMIASVPPADAGHRLSPRRRVVKSALQRATAPTHGPQRHRDTENFWTLP
jgi:hypothetical protein